MRPPLSYRLLAGLAGTILPLATRLSPRLAEGDEGRSRSLERFLQWSRESRDPARPLVWFHAPSVGEGRQAEAVIAIVRAQRPEWQFAFSHFSPSAVGLAAELPVDVAGYLPWDAPGPVSQLIGALRPTALVFAKLDLWPEVVGQAAAAGAAVALVAGTVSRRSGRTRWPSRQLTRSAYATVDAAGAISALDAEGLTMLGVPGNRIVITGDPRADSVADRVAAVHPAEPLLALGDGRTLVAGSTWPEDEDILVGALLRLRSEGITGHRLIIAPHEPTAAHLARLETVVTQGGLTSGRLGRLASGSVPTSGTRQDVLVVDRLGILATLYGAGSVGYVGGGFGRAGLHSVLEPAAWGRPVLFGPRWEGSRDAELLLEAGGGRALAQDDPVAQLATTWREWSTPAGQAAGALAKGVVEQGIGSAHRSAELVIGLLEKRLGG